MERQGGSKCGGGIVFDRWRHEGSTGILLKGGKQVDGLEKGGGGVGLPKRDTGKQEQLRKKTLPVKRGKSGSSLSEKGGRSRGDIERPIFVLNPGGKEAELNDKKKGMLSITKLGKQQRTSLGGDNKSRRGKAKSCKRNQV